MGYKMKFGAIQNLMLLWFLIPLCIFLWWAIKNKEKLLARFSREELFKHITKSYDPKRHTLKNILLVLIVLFSCLALARPQWGYEMREIKRRGTDILLVVDVSRSMLTKDVKPSRLERTKLAIRDFIKKLKGDRVGLIAFAGDAFLSCPLTVDYGGFLLSLEDLSSSTVPRGGTNISAALREVLRQYDITAAKYKAVVIITDGENLEDDPMPIVGIAKEKGIKIFTIGVGTKDGELIQVTDDNGVTDFLKDSKGNIVKSRLNESLLQEIALATGGVYVRASGIQFGLNLIYDQELSKFDKMEFQSKPERRYFERFQIPLTLALLFFVFEILIPTRKKSDES
ncbi:MAG: VWA domain-containing protein [Candidatus Omnitrophica bacterium]|nr:VWA domain-containing protein [Candidatus Omnitrophota bacterium]